MNECIIVTNPMIAENGSVSVTLSKFLRVLSPHYTRLTVVGGNVTVDTGIAGVEVHSIPITRASSRAKRVLDIAINQIRLAKQLRRRAQKGLPVYFWIGDKQLLPFLAAKAKGADVRYFLYGNMAKEGSPGAMQRLSSRLAAFMANHATSVCVESPGVFHEWEGLLKNPNRRIIHLYTQPVPPAPAVEKTVVGMLCRLTGGKHVLESIQAFSVFHKSHPEYSLEIIGSGKLENACRELISSLSAQDYIHLPGWISHDRLPRRTAQWKYLLFPSDTEGMPNSVLELMGQGIPVLASPVGGIRDVVRHGENGWLLAGTDCESITRALCALPEYDRHYSSMAMAAHATVVERYTLSAAQAAALGQI